METSFESKIGKVALSDEKIFNLLSDFNNLKDYIPADKITNWQSDGESCHFTVNGMGDVSLKIIEKEPFKLIKISGDGMNKQNFLFWVQLKHVETNDTRVKLTIKADINPMMKMMVAKPVQKFLDVLIDGFEKMPFV